MQTYAEKKAYYDSLLTLYGRNSVMEALTSTFVTPVTLHLSRSNRQEGIILELIAIANTRNIPIKLHEKEALSRISKNAKQDQGVALDVQNSSYKSAEHYLQNLPENATIIALDGIQNPQNLGMIIRSVAASGIDAILLPSKESAKISPLVIKASAGTLFKTTILTCNTLASTLPAFTKNNFAIYGLAADAKESLFSLQKPKRSLFILGNEHEGISKEVASHCTHALAIPMQNGVESLNVAVTAALIAFCTMQESF
ncbi:MAG: RNA methyltransferase [Sulfurovum sp. PC08-66]|nr:MAG: RNA methyltransferase [Sulfurovum sp. PC08-66]KIM12516.1 MAG: RNA methyltransferase [Sulfuricurvum sp. PC08-66]